jgi:FlaA1/EpsC-like NDP-sugar epimerase
MYLAYYLRFTYLPNAQAGLEEAFLRLAPILSLSTIYSFYKNGLYKLQCYSSKFYEVLGLIRGNLTAFIGFVIVLYFLGEQRISRLTIIFYFFLTTIGFMVTRLTIRNFLRMLRKKGYNLRHVLLIGNW